MEGLLSILLFAVLFFVMMRFGCGAHMKHGHNKSDDRAGLKYGGHDTGQEKHIDPVRGMEVDTEQGYGKMHEGKLQRFCSRNCLDRFEADPEQYITKGLIHEKHHHEGGVL